MCLNNFGKITQPVRIQILGAWPQILNGLRIKWFKRPESESELLEDTLCLYCFLQADVIRNVIARSKLRGI